MVFKKSNGRFALICAAMLIIVFLYACPTFAAHAYTTEAIQAICNEYGFVTDQYWAYNPAVSGSSTSYKASEYGVGYIDKNGNQYKGYEYPKNYGNYECQAFAFFIGSKLSGCYNPYSDWTRYKNLEESDGLRVGDIVYTYDPSTKNGHAAVVYDISPANGVTFVECWGSVNNKLNIGGRFNGDCACKYGEQIHERFKLVYVKRAKDNTAPRPTIYSQVGNASLNGHEYRVYQGYGTWNTAREFADSLPGDWHLATITNEKEQEAVANLVSAYGNACWLGASSVSGAWQWVTGEAFDYSQWATGEPSGVTSSNVREYYLGIYGNGTATSHAEDKKWNDFTATSATIRGLVVEHDSDASTLPTGISLDKGSLKLDHSTGETAQLTATPTPSGATGEITWSSNNPAVATVDNGLVKAVSAGHATISASISDGSKTFTAQCAVTVASAYGTLKIRDMAYPSIYVMSSAGFSFTKGEVVSDQPITKITIDIKNSGGVSIAGHPVSFTPNAYRFSIASADSKILFNNIKTAGKYTFSISAADKAGKSLTLSMSVTAVSSGENVVITAQQTYRAADTLEIVDVSYPSTFKIDTVNGYYMRSGDVISNVALKSVTIDIKNASGTSVTGHPKTYTNIGATSFSILARDSDIYFTNIKSAGAYTFLITATDIDGKAVMLSMPVQAVASGTTVTAYGSASAYIPITGVSLTPQTTRLNYITKETLQLAATVAPSDATNRDIAWQSSNPQVATVSVTGLVTAVGYGQATITATAQDKNGTKTAACTVTTYSQVTSVRLAADAVTMLPGDKQTLIPAYLPTNAQLPGYTYTSSNAKVLTVNANGVVTAVAPGSAVIRATAKDGSLACGETTITVLTVHTIAYYDEDGITRISDLTPERFIEEAGANELPVYNKDDRAFFGWYASPDYAGVPVTAIPASEKDNVKLYARYAPYLLWERWLLNVHSGTNGGSVRLELNQTRTDIPAAVWTADRADIVQVEGHNGYAIITGLKEGVAYVTAKVGNAVAGVCQITVRSMDNVLRMPQSLKSIGANSFTDCAEIDGVVIPEGSITEIGPLAFSGCTALRFIAIPDSVKTISETAFSGCGDFVLYCASDSAAAAYAQAHNIPHAPAK